MGGSNAMVVSEDGTIDEGVLIGHCHVVVA